MFCFDSYYSVAIYAGVTAYNNGARGWNLVGAIFGGMLAGGAVGALVGLIAPMAGTLFTGGALALAGGGTAGFGAVGAVAVGTVVIGGLIAVEELLGFHVFFSKGNGPRLVHNQHEKQMWNEAMRQLGISDKDLIQRLHHLNEKKPYANTLKELLENLRDILRRLRG